MPEIRDTDWAYVAGLVDGEGCIAVTRSFNATRNRFYYGVAVVVVNGERPVLAWMQNLWDGRVVAMPEPMVFLAIIIVSITWRQAQSG